MPGRAKERDRVRLTTEFLDRVCERGWPKYDSFARFYRKELKLRGTLEHQFRLLKEGEYVDEPIARGFVEYTRRKWGWMDDAFDSIIESRSPSRLIDHGTWGGWENVLDRFEERFRPTKSMNVTDQFRDCSRMAQMIVHCLGYRVAAPGDPLDEAACIARGELHMGRSVDDYARWLIAMWRTVPRSVMFSVVKGKGRIGGSVNLPLTESAFDRLTNGEIGEGEIGPADLDPTSRYVFTNAISETVHDSTVSMKAMTDAQAHCAMYQVAYFTRKVRPYRPVILSFVGAPQYRDKQLSLGFKEVGVCLKGTDKPLMVLRPPRETGSRSVREYARYKMFTLCLEMYRLANRRHWKREDAMNPEPIGP